MPKNYSGSIALSKLTHVLQKRKNKEGKEIEVIVFPIDKNFFVRGKNGAIYMNLSVRVHDEPDQYDQNGFIAHRVPSEIYKAASYEEKEKFKELPILGNIKEFSVGGNDNSGAASERALEETDDLPF